MLLLTHVAPYGLKVIFSDGTQWTFARAHSWVHVGDELTLYGDGDEGMRPIEAQLRWSMVKYVLPLRSARRVDDE